MTEGGAAREIKLMRWWDTYKHSFDNQGMYNKSTYSYKELT